MAVLNRLMKEPYDEPHRYPAVESATAATANIYARVKKLSRGRVRNAYAALGHLVPASLAAMLDTQGTLNSGNLGRQEHKTIKLLISEKTGCVCVAARSFVGKLVGLPVDALRAIRAEQPAGDATRDPLVRFVFHLHATSSTISDEEVAAVRAADCTESQLAEISLTIAL